MDIDRLDEQRILITLEKGELDCFLESTQPVKQDKLLSPHIFFGMLTLAAVKSGISISGKRLTLHYINGNFYNFIIITVRPQQRLPAGRGIWIGAAFSDFYTMTEAISRIDLRNSDLVFHSELLTMWKTPVLLLFVNSSFTKVITSLLSEYSIVRTYSRLEISRLNEYGTIIAVKNELLFLFDSLSSNS